LVVLTRDGVQSCRTTTEDMWASNISLQKSLQVFFRGHCETTNSLEKL